LPEGLAVTVAVAPALEKPQRGERVEFPLVRSKRPGTVHLTGKRIAEILDDEDVSPRR
jgi:hypothetical protein